MDDIKWNEIEIKRLYTSTDDCIWRLIDESERLKASDTVVSTNSCSVQTDHLFHMLLESCSNSMALESALDLCAIVGNQWSEQTVNSSKNEAMFKRRIAELQEAMKSLEYECQESIRQNQLEAEKEIDQLRNVS